MKVARKVIVGLTLTALVLALLATQVYASDLRFKEGYGPEPSYNFGANHLQFKEHESIWRNLADWWFAYFTFNVRASRNQDLVCLALTKYDDYRICMTLGVKKIAGTMRWTIVLNGQTFTNLTANADLNHWHSISLNCDMAFSTNAYLSVDGQLVIEAHGAFEPNLVPCGFGIGILSGNPTYLSLKNVSIRFIAE